MTNLPLASPEIDTFRWRSNRAGDSFNVPRKIMVTGFLKNIFYYEGLSRKSTAVSLFNRIRQIAAPLEKIKSIENPVNFKSFRFTLSERNKQIYF